jgi:hypothetical protein
MQDYSDGQPQLSVLGCEFRLNLIRSFAPLALLRSHDPVPALRAGLTSCRASGAFYLAERFMTKS